MNLNGLYALIKQTVCKFSSDSRIIYVIVRGTNISFCGYFFTPWWGTFPDIFVEPERGRNPWEVQQKPSSLYLFLLSQIILNPNNLFLAVILICWRKHFRPLAKSKPKAIVEKGLDVRSCFGSPHVGDVERLRDRNRYLSVALVALTLLMWEMLKVICLNAT